MRGNRATACVMAFMSAHSIAEMTLTSPEMTGEVVHAQTGQPIAGAIVSAKWDGGYSSIGHGGTRCVWSAAVAADDSGCFRIPGWSRKHPDLQDLGIELAAYRPGYRIVTRATEGARPKELLGFIPVGEIKLSPRQFRLEMQRVDGQPDPRAAYLLTFLSSTDCREGGVKDMKPLYLAVRNEIQAFPPAVRDYRESPSSYSLLEEVDNRYLGRSK